VRLAHPSASAAAVGAVAEAHLVGGTVGGAVGGGAHASHKEAPPQPAPRKGVAPPPPPVAAAGGGGQSTWEPPAAGNSHTSSPKSSPCSSITEDAEIARTETLAEDEVRAPDAPRVDAPTGARADETSTGGPGPDLGLDLGPHATSSAAEVAPACQAAASTSGVTYLQGPMQGPMPDSGEFEVCLLCARHTATRRHPHSPAAPTRCTRYTMTRTPPAPSMLPAPSRASHRPAPPLLQGLHSAYRHVNSTLHTLLEGDNLCGSMLKALSWLKSWLRHSEPVSPRLASLPRREAPYLASPPPPSTSRPSYDSLCYSTQDEGGARDHHPPPAGHVPSTI